jgi:hypothetical protein
MRKVIGVFEKVDFPDFKLFDVVAKVDTGAFTGALHATQISEITLPTGEKALRFRPFDNNHEITVTAYRKKQVKSSNGGISSRYVISTTVTIEDVQYPINISLADRSSMMKGVLLGRRFLRKHGFLVDSRMGSQYRYEVK